MTSVPAPSVVALYRYPVKSFTPEPATSLTIGADGRVAGDRVLGFRFADTAEPDDQWASKHDMLALVNTPGLARLRLSFDPERLWLAIHLDGRQLVAGGLDPASRARMCDAVGEFVQSLPTSALRDRPDRLPLRLVGDGVTPRHQDDPDPYVTLHSRASLDAVRGVIGDPELDEVRFRTNIVIDAVEPWAELGWVGRRVRIGNVEAVVDYACERCLATHADPVTGQRDRSISKALVTGFHQSEPTFAVALEFRGPGTIRIGDPVELLA